MTEFELVQNFNEKLLKITPREPGEQPYQEFVLSCKQLREAVLLLDNQHGNAAARKIKVSTAE